MLFGLVAQSVEQRTENPCVGGSIPPLGTILINYSHFMMQKINDALKALLDGGQGQN